VKAVAAGDVVGLEPAGRPGGITIVHADPILVEPAQRDGLGVEDDRRVGRQQCRDEVFDDFLLAVDGNALAAGELLEINAVVACSETELGPGMNEPLAPQALADADCGEQFRRSVLEHTGAHASFDVLTGARLDDDRLYAGLME
jgi:hypothetical protein